MTMKNILFVIFFAIITASQFVLGIWMSVIAAREGGKDKFWNRSHSEH